MKIKKIKFRTIIRNTNMIDNQNVTINIKGINCDTCSDQAQSSWTYMGCFNDKGYVEKGVTTTRALEKILVIVIQM